MLVRFCCIKQTWLCASPIPRGNDAAWRNAWRNKDERHSKRVLCAPPRPTRGLEGGPGGTVCSCCIRTHQPPLKCASLTSAMAVGLRHDLLCSEVALTNLLTSPLTKGDALFEPA